MSDILPPGPELDALVSEAMGKPVVGWATVVYVDGEASIDSETTVESWGGLADHRPIYVHKCLCGGEQVDSDLADGPRPFGHYESCLAPVERYSGSWDMAGELVEFLRDLKWYLELVNTVDTNLPYRAVFMPHPSLWAGTHFRASQHGVTGPHAISLAFVEAARLMANKEENK